jgi:hypothetical protein
MFGLFCPTGARPGLLNGRRAGERYPSGRKSLGSEFPCIFLFLERKTRRITSEVAVKRCSHCCVRKPRSEYYAHPSTRDGLASRCKTCHRAAAAGRLDGVPAPVLAVRDCRWCGGEYETQRPKGKGSYPSYCSDRCARAVRWNGRSLLVAPRRECRCCGDLFVPPRGGSGAWNRSALCSAACRSRIVLLDRYGLTAESYAAMLERQGHRCAACGDEFGSQGPHIDHCHDGGHVRGVLCQSCNVGIGHLKDDAERAFDCAVYLLRDRDVLGELMAA